MSNLVYDNNWILTLSNIHASSNMSGVFTGNGKIGLQTSLSDISIQKTLISAANLQFDQVGKYRSNTIETFALNNVKFITLSDQTVVNYAMQHQSLDMQTGKVSTSFDVTSSSIALSVNNVITPLRQFPYCILQTLEITPSSNLPALDIFHEYRAPQRTSSLNYANNVIYNESLYEDKGLYIFNASGHTDIRDCTITGASCYLFGSNIVDPMNLGYNVGLDRSFAFQKWRIRNLVGGTTYRIHILSSAMTSLDFSDPLEESKRILLNIAFKEPQITTLISKLAADNKEVWDEMWTSDIEIVPKSMVTSTEMSSVMKVKKYIRLSLFNMFACLRNAINTEINPLNLSYIDTDGNVYFDGDLWLIPVMIFLKPHIARVMLEFKYMLMSQAIQLASSFGYRGSKFPYKNDVIGYKNVYWDVISPLHIFNNANICINIWNYYRVTLDRDWLLTKGYPMMKNIADFLSYYAKIVQDRTVVPNTLGLGEIVSDNNAFTMNVIGLSLRYAIEASNVLSIIPNNRWGQILLKLSIPAIAFGENVDVILYSSSYDGTNQVDILDNLITLLPYYNTLFYSLSTTRNRSSIARNLNYYSTRVKPEYANHVVNRLIRAGLLGTLAQTDTTRMGEFYTGFLEILDTNFVGPWGVMNTSNKPELGNDISLNAFVILIVIVCLCGLNIRGSTAPSNVVVETYRIDTVLGTFMPNTWASVRLGAIGPNETFLEVANQLPYNA